MKIYLDTNVYCRPFDDQTQKRIQDEAEAFEKILHEVRCKNLDLIISDILVFEVKNILSYSKRTKVEEYLLLCLERIIENEDVRNLAKRIKRECKTKDRDAIHLASAMIKRISYFLTCDDTVLSKSSCIKKISKEVGEKMIVQSPIDFVGTHM